jgi:phthalate 4,5-dioxygenase oxygenase subunit
MGTGDQQIPASVCAFQSVIPKTTDWREYETQPIWKDNPVNPELDTAYSVRT